MCFYSKQQPFCACALTNQYLAAFKASSTTTFPLLENLPLFKMSTNNPSSNEDVFVNKLGSHGAITISKSGIKRTEVRKISRINRDGVARPFYVDLFNTPSYNFLSDFKKMSSETKPTSSKVVMLNGLSTNQISIVTNLIPQSSPNSTSLNSPTG